MKKFFLILFLTLKGIAVENESCVRVRPCFISVEEKEILDEQVLSIIEKGDKDTLEKMIVSQQISPNYYMSSANEFILATCIRLKNIEMMQCLLKNGVEVVGKFLSGVDFLEYAKRVNADESLINMLDNYIFAVQNKMTVIMQGLNTYNSKIIRYLLYNNMIAVNDLHGKNGQTLLHLCVAKEVDTVIRLNQGHKVDDNAETKAVFIRDLIKLGFSVDGLAYDQSTPLDFVNSNLNTMYCEYNHKQGLQAIRNKFMQYTRDARYKKIGLKNNNDVFVVSDAAIGKNNVLSSEQKTYHGVQGDAEQAALCLYAPETYISFDSFLYNN